MRQTPDTGIENMKLKQELKELIISDLNLCDITPEDIKDQDPIFGEEGLALDSLDAVELVVIIKKKYGVNLQDIEKAKIAFRSIETLSEYLENELES
jgi:acyl carrier protein